MEEDVLEREETLAATITKQFFYNSSFLDPKDVIIIIVFFTIVTKLSRDNY